MCQKIAKQQTPHPSTGPDSFLAPIMLDSTKDSEGLKPGRYKKRCSEKGVLPLSSLDYLQLPDLTARMQRSDKRGYTPRDLPPLLERLGIDTERWRMLMKDFGRSCCSRSTWTRQSFSLGSVSLQGLE
ncbi:MAG: hypothetical protein ACK56W_09455 [Pirellula sp.]|nr:hypothetical protein [Pirellula sp.]